MTGLVQLLRHPDWRRARLPAITFVVVTLVFVVTGGKGYYLAGAIVPLVAAGCTWIARNLATRRLLATGAVLALSAAIAWPALVPMLPASTYADSFYGDLNDDLPEEIGWPEYTAQVRNVVADLPDGAVVFTGNYGEAGAFEWYGVGAPVYSGHNGWRNWGPPPEGTGPVVVVYYRDPSVDFTGCERAATLHNRSASTTRRRARASGSATGRSARGRRAGTSCPTTTRSLTPIRKYVRIGVTQCTSADCGAGTASSRWMGPGAPRSKVRSRGPGPSRAGRRGGDRRCAQGPRAALTRPS